MERLKGEARRDAVKRARKLFETRNIIVNPNARAERLSAVDASDGGGVWVQAWVRIA